MSSPREHDSEVEKIWQYYLMTGKVPPGARQIWLESGYIRLLAKFLPHNPPCRICHDPFAGFVGMEGIRCTV